jgi:hypothetical protein
MKVNVFAKCVAVIKSCETHDQLEQAAAYISLAVRNKYINRDSYDILTYELHRKALFLD